MYRIGNGIDIHRLVKGVPLFIGGVLINHHKGSYGHSDGDVLYHAITDAFLGSLGAGDIGQHFPSSSNKWKDVKSQTFVEYAYNIITEKNFKIINIDCTIILQKPKINHYIHSMKNNIYELIKIKKENISIKATTTDHLGFIGEKKGICAFAMVIIEKRKKCQHE